MRLPIASGFLLVLALLAPSTLSAQASSPAHAQPVGVPLNTIIGFGNQYDGGDEFYDVRITVLEVVRGAKAWDILKRADASNAPPKPGCEYLLARVRFEFSARTSPHHYNYTLRQNQFTAISAAEKEYESPALAMQPSPPLSGTLRSGDSLEGWLAFQVPESERRPLMVFHEDVGSVFHEGGGSFFQLYDGSAIRRPTKSSQSFPRRHIHVRALAEIGALCTESHASGA